MRARCLPVRAGAVIVRQMVEGELRTEPMSRTARVVVVGVLALVVGPPAAYLPYAARAVDGLEVAGSGYAVEPAGRLVATDEGVLLTYPPRNALRLRLRVPVRNTSRLTLHLRHATGAEPAAENEEWPTATVRIGAGETAWLTFERSLYGCPGSGVGGGGAVQVHGVQVSVRARATDERQITLPLPVPYRMPLLPAADCAGGLA